MCPSAATKTISGSSGCTTIRPITWVSRRPLNSQLSPPSVDLKIPPPGEIELRESSSPVPAQIWLGSLGAMARSPIAITRGSLKIERKVIPLLVVFQMPPAAPAT